MASPREGRRSDANRLTGRTAAAFVLIAAPAAAHAQGQGTGIVLISFAIGMLGILACFAVHMVVGRARMGRRLLEAVGLAILDAAIAWAVIIGTLVVMNKPGETPIDQLKLYMVAAILAWPLPIYLFIRGVRRRG